MSYFDCSGNAKAVQFLFSNNANKRGNWWDNSNFIQAKRVSGTNEWQITNDDLPQSPKQWKFERGKEFKVFECADEFCQKGKFFVQDGVCTDQYGDMRVDWIFSGSMDKVSTTKIFDMPAGAAKCARKCPPSVAGAVAISGITGGVADDGSVKPEVRDHRTAPWA